MAPNSPLRTRPVRRRSYVAAGLAYAIFCGSVLAIASLGVRIPPQQTAETQKTEIPVATIQSFPDVNDMCRILLFHNDTGRYQEGGTAPCQNLISKKVLVWTVTDRAREFAKVFRSSW